jgi:hypothetical protein
MAENNVDALLDRLILATLPAQELSPLKREICEVLATGAPLKNQEVRRLVRARGRVKALAKRDVNVALHELARADLVGYEQVGEQKMWSLL